MALYRILLFLIQIVFNSAAIEFKVEPLELLATDCLSKPEVIGATVTPFYKTDDNNRLAWYMRIECLEGYIWDKKVDLRCSVYRVWYGHAACVPKETFTCIEMPQIEHSLKITFPSSFETVFECEEHYKVYGSNTIYCMDDGKWLINGKCRRNLEDMLELIESNTANLSMKRSHSFENQIQLIIRTFSSMIHTMWNQAGSYELRQEHTEQTVNTLIELINDMKNSTEEEP